MTTYKMTFCVGYKVEAKLPFNILLDKCNTIYVFSEIKPFSNYLNAQKHFVLDLKVVANTTNRTVLKFFSVLQKGFMFTTQKPFFQ